MMKRSLGGRASKRDGTRRPSRRYLAMVAIVGLIAAGCSSEDDGDDGGDDASEEPEGDGGEASSGDLGEPMPTMSIVYYATDHGPTYENSARVLADGFGEIGLDVELAPMQQSTMVGEIHVGGGLEHLAYGSWGGDPERLDPGFWVESLTACDSNRNAVKWCDEEYSELAVEQGRTLDEDERLEMVHELQEIAHEELPWWMVSHETAGMLYNSDRWENVTEPSPIPPHETVIQPWLDMEPTGDDRVIDWAYFEDLSSYNPYVETVSQGWLKFVYDTLLRFDAEQIVPWAAESYEAVDDTTIELTLREGMTFHDGEPVTADDVAFSINLAIEHQPPTYSGSIESLESATAEGELDVTITLNEPNAAVFRDTLVKLPILPEHIWADVEDPLEYDPEAEGQVIGSGPFAFEAWERDQFHEFSVHTDHWAAPAYDGIRRLSLGQADAVQASLLDGSADIATQVVPAATMQEMADAEDHLGFVESQTVNTTTVWVNHEEAPYNDLEFRRALRYATDKQRVADEGWLGFAIPAGEGIVPTLLGEWHNDDLEPYAFDIEMARQILEDAGYGWDEEGMLHFPAE